MVIVSLNAAAKPGLRSCLSAPALGGGQSTPHPAPGTQLPGGQLGRALFFS